MDSVKKYLGIVWVLLGPALVFFMCRQAYEKITAADAAHKLNAILQWSIILLVFIPVCVGLVIFGYYAFKGEYKKTPANSGDIS